MAALFSGRTTSTGAFVSTLGEVESSRGAVKGGPGSCLMLTEDWISDFQ